MSVEGEQCRSVKLDEGEVALSEERSSRCTSLAGGMEQWAASERLQEGQGRGQRSVEGAGVGVKGFPGHANEACLVRWLVGVTRSAEPATRASRETKRRRTVAGLIPTCALQKQDLLACKRVHVLSVSGG